MSLLVFIVLFFGPPVFFLINLPLGAAVVASVIYALGMNWILGKLHG